jgi:CRISPR/Cas system-associated exonuclease Cas4 (RecB family)
MQPIRASEISAFLYCKRAWWYQQRGIESANVEELAEGTQLHQQHGRAVFASSLTRTLAYGLLLVALVLLAIYATNLVL